MKWISIVCLCALFVGQAQAGEFARVELEIDRGPKLFGTAVPPERLRLDLVSGDYALRGDGFEAKGRDADLTRALNLQLLLGDDALKPLGQPAARGPWKYVLRLFKAGGSTAARTIRGSLAGPTVAGAQLPTALRAVLRIRQVALTSSAASAAAVRVARLEAIPGLLFKIEPEVLVARVRHEIATNKGPESVSAVKVFSDGRVELRAGINSLDLDTHLRFRVSPSRCQALAEALKHAPESSSRPTAPLDDAHLVFASPNHTSPAVFGRALPKPWQAVNAALDELLSKLELRGELAGRPDHELHKKAGNQEHWPRRVGRIDLEWQISEVLQRKLLERPTPFPLALKGHYRLPLGQRWKDDGSLVFVVTEVVTGSATGIDQSLAPVGSR